MRFRKRKYVCIACGHLQTDTKEEHEVTTLPFMVSNQAVTGVLTTRACTVCLCTNHNGFTRKKRI